MFGNSLKSLNFIMITLLFMAVGCGAKEFASGQGSGSNSADATTSNDEMSSADAKSSKGSSKSKSKSKSDKYGDCLELTAGEEENLEYYYDDALEDEEALDQEELHLSKTKSKNYCKSDKKSKSKSKSKKDKK